MENECSECGANLAINQTECAYCGAAQTNADERLLVELMNLLRKYETAYAQGDKIVVESLLADDFELVEIDGGIELRVNRKTTLENAVGDERFLSYSISGEKLLERTARAAKIACVQTIHRRMDGDEPYISRAKVNFARDEGTWKIAAQYLVTIDENGQETKI